MLTALALYSYSLQFADFDAAISPSTGNNNEKAGATETQSSLFIGIAVGACAVLVILILVLVMWKIRRQQRRQKKDHRYVRSSSRLSNELQQVTLMPLSRQTSHLDAALSDHSDRRTIVIQTHADLRPPPSYNESVLDIDVSSGARIASV